MVGNAGAFGNVGKGAVSIVAEQPAGHRLVNLWNAIVMLSIFVNAARFVLILAKSYELPNEQIQQAVVVVVEPYGAGGPPRSGHAGFCVHVGKRAFSIVVIQNAFSVLGHIGGGESASIIVPHTNALAQSPRRPASLFGDVGERAVAIVSIQSVPQ